MRREIMKYMTDELNFSSDDAKYFSKQITEYDDIANEFLMWMKNKNYDYSPAMEINGWTAKKITRETNI